MEKTNKNLTNEKKSFKEIVRDNRGKIIAGVGLVSSAVVGIIAYKLYEDNKELRLECIKNTKELINTKKDLNTSNALCVYLNDRANTTEDILVNSGIIDQARATMTRKKDTLVGKLNCLLNVTTKDPDIERKISELRSGILGYEIKLDDCDVLEDMYIHRNNFETLLDD